MNKFRTYEKIHRLGKEETDGILLGTVHVTEKIDGANLSMWMEDGVIHVGSRTTDITERADTKEGSGNFSGVVRYAQEHPGIVKFFENHPTWRLYGEWLVRHTISYKETAYRKFYLFDILTEEGYLPTDKVVEFGKSYGIDYAPYHGSFENPTYQQIKEFVGKTEFGDRGEGIVIKNPEFVNQFGDKCYAKVVTQEFKEDNALVFGGNNKHSDTYWEIYFIQKYVTLARVKKVMSKIEPEVGKRLGMEHIPRIMGTVLHDIWSEEGWQIFNDAPALDFKAFKGLANRKIKQVYVDILEDNISAADKTNEQTHSDEGSAGVGEVDAGAGAAEGGGERGEDQQGSAAGDAALR